MFSFFTRRTSLEEKEEKKMSISNPHHQEPHPASLSPAAAAAITVGKGIHPAAMGIQWTRSATEALTLLFDNQQKTNDWIALVVHVNPQYDILLFVHIPVGGCLFQRVFSFRKG